MIKIKNSFSFFYHWHQRIGLVMCIAVIAWALSGLAHPLISRLNPKPAATPPPAPLHWQDVKPVEQMITANGLQDIQHLRLFQWQGQPVYRIESEQGRTIFSATDLSPIPEGERRYAEYLARQYLGDTSSPIVEVSLVEQFDSDYLYINRYLPVMRVDFARGDNARVYVDLRQGRLATLVDNRKALTGAFFRTLHSWTWIDSMALRQTLMSLFLVLGFCTAAFGLALYIKSWRLGIFRRQTSAHQHHPLSRKLHRHLGAAVSVFAMAFCLSGMFHLLVRDKSDQPQPALAHATKAAELQLNVNAVQSVFGPDKVLDVQLAKIGPELYWQVREHRPSEATASEHHHHHGHHTPEPPPKDAVGYIQVSTGTKLEQGWSKHAQSLALAFSGHPADSIRDVRLIKGFGGEYGFVNKRLPVHAVDFDLPGNPTLYLETATQTLASAVTDVDRLEGYSFGYLHKWHFVDFLGKDIRDLLTSLVALSVMTVLLLGVYRYLTTRRRRRA